MYKTFSTTYLKLISLFFFTIVTSCSDEPLKLLPGVVQDWSGDSLMNKGTKPGDDFYDYANGVWMANNPVGDDSVMYGYLADARDENKRKYNKLLHTTNDPMIVTSLTLAEDYIRSGDLGKNAIMPLINKILTVNNRAELYETIAHVMRDGYFPFFTLRVHASPSSERIFVPVLFRYKPAYDVKKYKNQSFVKDYSDCIASSVSRVVPYITDERIEKITANAVSVELWLIDKLSYDGDDYDFTSAENIKKYIPLNNTRAPSTFTEMLALSGINRSCLLADDAIFDVVRYLENANIEVLKDYLIAHIIMENRHNFDLYSHSDWRYLELTYSLLGKNESSDFDQRVKRDFERYAPEHLSRLYADAFANESNKNRMEAIAAQLRSCFRDRIQNNKWMGETTKHYAIEKLDNMVFYISHPTRWPEFKASPLSKESYCAAVSGLRRDSYTRMLDLIDKPIAQYGWQYILRNYPLYTLNCFYFQLMNSICIEPVFCNDPMFNQSYSDAYIYGTIGTVISHEMSHGFDNNGASFDKSGMLVDWWDESDKIAYEKLQKRMIDWFSGLEIMPGMLSDGKRTLGENIADLGGVAISSDVFSRTLARRGLSAQDHKTEMQHFYISYAQIWRQNGSRKSFDFLRINDVHSVGRLRVMGIIPMQDSWNDAFDITSSDKMYISPADRILIW